VVRIPSLSRRGERTAVTDENADGRIDERDDRIAAEERRGAEYDRNDRSVGLRDADRRVADERADDERAYDRDADERDVTRGRVPVYDRSDTEPATTADADVVEPVVRPRASGLATLGLLLGFAGAGAVATGVLAVPGVALGLLGILFSVAGLGSTARPYVVGKLDAMLGLLFALAAVVVGLLALGNAIPWPDTETNQVARLSDWLYQQMPWLDRF
jgi:hypothetical protein